MSPDRREDGGRFVERVTLDDVYGVFETVEGPVVTSGDVAEALDCSRETARRKLHRLGEIGRVESRETAGRIVWWQTDTDTGPSVVDPQDAFWKLSTGASGESDVSESIDDVLYDG